MHWKQWMIAVLLIGLVLPLNSQTGLAAGGAPISAGCTQRPLADILDAQGSTQPPRARKRLPTRVRSLTCPANSSILCRRH
ncbi:MAG: hypothetical protein KDE19_16495 [Caldilineaceae bacterium]|nr:hypothetical protein [Caldilineaceae bacterium]